MAKKNCAEFLKSEDGKRNAERFIKALSEGRIICSVKSVARSGMSRVIRVCEVRKIDGSERYTMLQFNWFLEQMGWTYVESQDGIRVNGCGMDMVFHLLYSTCGSLKYYGFELPEGWSKMCNDCMRI